MTDHPRRSRPLSPRLRLTLAAAVVIAACLAAASYGAVAALRHSLLAAVDSAARDDAVDVASRLPQDRPAAVVDPPTPDAAVQVVDRSGRVRAASPGAPARPLLTADPAPARLRVTATGPLPIRSGADAYHVATLVDADSGFTVYVALPSDDATDAVRELSGVLELGAPVLFVVIIGLAWLVVGRALAPVEAAQQRQREFVADAAHELRTPLAALGSELELAGRESAALAARLPVLQGEVARLGRLVDGLLTLARPAGRPSAWAEVDLDDVVRAAIDRVRAHAPVPVDATAVGAARVRGDRGDLARLVDNLLDNAVRHARSRVEVTLAAQGPTATLVVADDGPGITSADRERVFERFTRLDPARSSRHGGVGLGLAIARSVARAHRGEIAVTDNRPGARFAVRLPTAAPSPR